MKTKKKFRVYLKPQQEYHFRAALKAFDPNATMTPDNDTLIVETYLSEFDIKFTSVLKVEHWLHIALNATISMTSTLTVKQIQDRVTKYRLQSPIVYSLNYTLKSIGTKGNTLRETNVNLMHISRLHIQPNYTESTELYLRHINPSIDSICSADFTLDNKYPIRDIILNDDCEIVIVYDE